MTRRAAHQPTTGPSNEEAMTDLLAPKGACRAIGAETGVLLSDGISHLVSPQHSHRYLLRRRGEPVAVLQVLRRIDGRTGLIANVYVVPDERRVGHASTLLERARRDFDAIEHSEHLSPDGAAWAAAVER